MNSPFQFPKMLPVFRDDQMQEAFERDGYVVVEFYNEEELDRIRIAYKELHPNPAPGFYASTFSPDENYRTAVDHVVREVGQRSMDAVLKDYAVHFGSFIVKASDEKSVMGIHQDMTLVDETRFSGINIWVPLVDLTTENGAIQVLPGSHRIMPTYRGATIKGIYVDVKETIYPLLKPLFLKAGQAIIFDQSIIHYSPANQSGDLRVVTNTFFTHRDVEFRIVWHDKENHGNQVEMFKMEPDFIFKHRKFGEDIYGRPVIGESMGLVPYEFPMLTEEILLKKYGKLER